MYIDVWHFVLFSFSTCDKNMKHRRKRKTTQTLVFEDSSAIHSTLKYNTTNIQNKHICSRKQLPEKTLEDRHTSACSEED